LNNNDKISFANEISSLIDQYKILNSLYKVKFNLNILEKIQKYRLFHKFFLKRRTSKANIIRWKNSKINENILIMKLTKDSIVINHITIVLDCIIKELKSDLDKIKFKYIS
jgi:hypothetical protein